MYGLFSVIGLVIKQMNFLHLILNLLCIGNYFRRCIMNECDHILGFSATYHEIVKESTKDYYVVHVQWSFCPECGEKLKES